MTRIFWTIAIVALLGMSVAAGPQGTKPDDKMREQLAAQSRPGEAHPRLAPLVGSWTFTMRFDAGPLGKGEESGTLEIRSVMGGRFYVEEAKTRFLGQPFEWVGTHGYDTQQKRYVSSWIDNLSTQIDG